MPSAVHKSKKALTFNCSLLLPEQFPVMREIISCYFSRECGSKSSRFCGFQHAYYAIPRPIFDAFALYSLCNREYMPETVSRRTACCAAR